MRETRSSKCRYAVGWACPLLFLTTISLGMLSTGCFVLTSERRNKPDAPRNLVKLHGNSDSLRYYRLFDCLDYDLDVGVESGPDRWQPAFLDELREQAGIVIAQRASNSVTFTWHEKGKVNTRWNLRRLTRHTHLTAGFHLGFMLEVSGPAPLSTSVRAHHHAPVSGRP